MERYKFKARIEKELNGLKREQVINFARHCSLRALPFIGGIGNFNFWKNENRQRYLYHIFYAIDFPTAYYAYDEAYDEAEAAANAAVATFAYDKAKVKSIAEAKSEAKSIAESIAESKAEAATEAVATAAAYATAYADRTDKAAEAATEAAANAAVYTVNAADKYNLKKAMEQKIFEDLKKIKISEQPIISIKEYGIVWNNFQLALKNEGCKYWGRLYQDIFDNNFKIDKEALKRRLSVPKEIREQGATAVANYLISLEKGAKRLNEARVIILGDKGAGKTCVARKLVNPKAEMTTDEESTAGVDTLQWSIEEDEKEAIKVNIWDFAGHTVTHAVHQFFLSERCLYIMVYDGRTEERNRLVYWLNHMKNFGGDSKAIILVNKRDNHSVQIPINNLKEEYPILGVYYFSVKDDTKDLKKFRSNIADYIISNPSWKKQDIPLSYYEVKEELEAKFSNALEHISKKEFDTIAQKNGIENSEQLLKDLHALGISLWYQEMEKYDTLILNPEWISHGVYKIINWANNKDKHSILLKEFLQVFSDDLKRYPAGESHEFLFDLMKHYELAYQPKTGKRLIIPHLLTDDRPDILPHFGVEESLRIKYKAEQPLPPNTISRFIVRHHQQIKNDKLLWRYGVVLEDGKGSLALIREEDRTIIVSVKGVEKTAFLDELRTTLNDIFYSYKNKKPELKYRIQRFGEVIVKGKSENELWLSEGKIINHLVLNKPYLDDVMNNLIPMNPIVKSYQIQSRFHPTTFKNSLESDEFAKLKKDWNNKLRKADLERVLNELEKYIEDKNDTYSEKELTQITARFYRAEKNFGKGIMELKDHNLEMNQINDAILKFIDNLG